jgi:hypothetical protein
MYPLIRIPAFANKSFFDFTKSEAKDYLQWFLEIKTERIKTLESQVQQVYPEWKLDYTKTSLKRLYEWFKGQIAYRPMNEEEKVAVKMQLSVTPLLAGVIPIPQTTFTEQTVTICFDVGLYFGESLIFNVPELKWMQKLTSSNFIDYAQPVIAKKDRKVPINPRRAVEGIAMRILYRDAKEITFADFFDMSYEKFSR